MDFPTADVLRLRLSLSTFGCRPSIHMPDDSRAAREVPRVIVVRHIREHVVQRVRG